MNTVSMTAPVGGDSKKIDNVEKIPTGFQLCTLYGMADLLTQDGGQYGPKHKIALMFEFPLQKRVFYEGDEPKPSAAYMSHNFSMHEKAGLRDMVHGMLNRKLTEDEAKAFNLSSLLGKSFVATIVHTPDGKYANIDTLTPLSDNNKMLFGIDDISSVERINAMFFFAGSQGFNSDNFGSLPNFIKDKIKSTPEAKAHIMSGGTFNEGTQGNGTSPGQAPTPAKRKLVMIATDYTYDQYKVNWTDEMLVQHGKAKWEEAVAPPTPVSAPSPSSSPSAPAMPSSPAPEVPAPTPTAPQVPVSDGFTMKDGSDPAPWIEKGWTKELLVQHGHASFQ